MDEELVKLIIILVEIDFNDFSFDFLVFNVMNTFLCYPYLLMDFQNPIFSLEKAFDNMGLIL